MTGDGARAARATAGLCIGLGAVLALAPCACKRTSGPPTSSTATPTRLALAQLLSASGDAKLQRSGQPPTNATPGSLYADDLLTTGAGGTMQLRLSDGRELTLAENTKLRLGEKKRIGTAGETGAASNPAQGAGNSAAAGFEIVLNLGQGSVTTRNPPGAGAAGDALSLSIMTPFGITRVPAGQTAGTIRVANANLKIDVSLGNISFAAPGGKIVVATAGDKIEGAFGNIELVRAGAAATGAAATGATTPPGAARSTVIDLAPIEFVLAAVTGPVSVRRPGEKRFAPLKAAAGIVEGTAFKVPVGGRGHLAARGLSAWLASGTEGTLGKASADGDKERFELGLTRGTSTLMLGGGKPKEVRIAGPHGDVSVSTTEQTSVSVSQGVDGPVIDVLAGAADVASGGAHQRVQAGSVVRLQGGKLTIGSRAAADFTLPTLKGLRVFADDVHEVALTWPAEVRQATVEIARDAAFVHLISAGRVSGPPATVTPPARGDLYWRVTDGTSRRVWSGQARFAPEDKPAAAAAAKAPRTLVAETGLRATVHFQSALPALTFSFAPQNTARQYHLRVYPAADPKKPQYEQTVAETSCPLPAGTLREGSYLWTVAAIESTGAELPPGPTNSLDLVFDNALTSLLIERPSPNEHVGGAAVPLRGATPLGNALFVNDKPVTLDAKGRFDTQAAPKNPIIFRLVDRGGGETYWVRELNLAKQTVKRRRGGGN